MMSRQSLISDDEEFIKCQYCHLSVQSYNNTAIETTSTITLYTKKLLSFKHANCEKCGLFIEFHPKEANDESLIFICSNSVPHKHCLCYECGLLYGLNTKRKSMGIIDLLQDSKTENAQEIGESQPDSTTANLMAASVFSSSLNNMVSNSSLITSMMHEAARNDVKTKLDEESINESDGTLLMGTICALLVWIGIYFNIPDVFRLTLCIIWVIIFYVLSNLYFAENSNMQRAVYSLFGFTPIFASLWILQKTRNRNDLHNDIRTSIYFFAVSSLAAYLSFYWTPLDMAQFLINDFSQLTLSTQLLSVFFAGSIISFIFMLSKRCGVTFKFMTKDLSLSFMNDFNFNDARADKFSADDIDIDIHFDKNEQELKIHDSHSVESELQTQTQTQSHSKKKRKRKKRRRNKRRTEQFM